MTISHLKKNLSSYFIGIKPETTKVVLLAIAFFCISWSFTCVGELKDALFITFVGKEFIKWAKLWGLLILIPAILIYSRLVDKLPTFRLLYVYSILYAFGCLGASLCISHSYFPHYQHIFGWIFYFFMEGFSPFVIGVFWAFLTSISTPTESKKNYVLIIGSLQLGGIASSLFCWTLLTKSTYTSIANHQIILIITSFLLFLVPIIIRTLFKIVPKEHLRGYQPLKIEVTYKEPKGSLFKKIFNGLILFTKKPYILGIFGMLFFWEVVNIVFSYQRLLAGANSCKNLSELSGLFFGQTFLLYSIGLGIVLLGSGPLINRLGYRKCLIFIPTIIGILITFYLFYPSLENLSLVYVLLRAINFAFAAPLREVLYTPTSSEIRFKSKSWIDVFGSRFAKSFGSYYNIFTATLAESLLFAAHSVFFATILCLWILTAYFLGKRFEEAIKKNELIN